MSAEFTFIASFSMLKFYRHRAILWSTQLQIKWMALLSCNCNKGFKNFLVTFYSQLTSKNFTH